MKGARTELKVLALLQQDIQQRFSLRSLSSTTFILSFQPIVSFRELSREWEG
jgi:hypothetical protein